MKPPRGEIRDRNGLPLAVTLPLSYAVGFRPASGLDLDNVANKVSAILPLSRETVRRKLDASSFIYLARRIDWKLKQHLESTKMACLQFDQEARRSYPVSTSLATVIGFTNVDGIGQEGIERALDKDLAGAEYSEVRWNDAKRTTAAVLRNDDIQHLRGADVTLTIDLQLQNVVENALAKGLETLDYERSCAILVDPWTGDILALATLPTYDPNRPGESRAENRKCWPITDVYEPGSTFKVIPVIHALEAQLVRRSSIIYCENGAYRVPGATIHDSHPYGDLTVDSVLAYSSNIGAAKIALKIKPADFYDRIRAFGFGNSTGIEIAGEQSGVVPKPPHWTGPTCANLAMGQGVSCTALQLAMAYAAIANGGSLMKPNLVLSTHYPDGSTEKRVPEIIRTVMTSETAANIQEMLVNVVKYGTGKSAAVEGLSIAGKTGTAQKVDQENHTYFQKRFVSSFVGFFPAEEPRYLLLVVVDDPMKRYFGATVAAPVFREIAQQLMDIRPADFPAKPKPPVIAEIVQPDSADSLLEFDLDPAAISLIDSLSATRNPDISMIEMPSVKGLPLRQAALELSSRGLVFQLNGSGIVSAQYPHPGDMVPAGFNCMVLAKN
ncbi:PASTA domain-containing protein [bacterium]|nr:PASTA domain-containing protein [bacterium]